MVEARYRGREKYYKGKISRDRGDGTYDIAYDDGERETTMVEERLIRKRERGSSRSRSRGADDRLSEGDKVEADYRGRGKFYPGKITRDRGDDTVRHFLRRRRARDSRREAPDPEDGRRIGQLPRRRQDRGGLSRPGKFYPGKISRDRGDDTYDIDYDDGERETRVAKRLIRSKEGSGGSSKLEEGDKVEARYRGREKYYPGKITRDRGDGTYDIAYDDGERETRVEERLIKKKDGGGGSDSFREGDKIEADYRGRGKFYPGKISRDRGDDTYDIDYDDGEAGDARLQAPDSVQGRWRKLEARGGRQGRGALSRPREVLPWENHSGPRRRDLRH